MVQIDIGSVLNRFDDTADEITSAVKEYCIRFFTAEGKLRTMRARKNVKAPQQRLSKPLDNRGGITWSLKRNGTILLHDLDVDSPRTVRVATIIAFKDFHSSNWQKVYH